MRVVDNRAVGSLFLIAMLLIFNSKRCGAAVLVEKNRTSSGCRSGGGQIDDGYGMELEVLTESYVHRVLQSRNRGSTTAVTNNPKATLSCRPYSSCLGDKKVANNCNTFNRECRKR
ncbi:hypothetical protein HRI_003482200 [Hibiscus trionum]|uniref:Uncharacterized protein n=1 Tax=Hibiscus trionum TaxID=183268 RepID=A0A9W7IK52_HIBTR|nr:hypothetical protein HRI_003482200 [Hibiscus trionum]